jgi:20S proteasome alpha/beta subunit
VTTVAYKDGVLASDSRVTSGTFIYPGAYDKVFRIPDGSLYAFCGRVEAGMRLLKSLMDDEDPPQWKSAATGIHIHTNGQIWTYEGGGLWLRDKGKYAAWGSGSPYAYGAMAANADAVEAVRIAKKFDNASGGSVKALRL